MEGPAAYESAVYGGQSERELLGVEVLGYGDELLKEPARDEVIELRH